MAENDTTAEHELLKTIEGKKELSVKKSSGLFDFTSSLSEVWLGIKAKLPMGKLQNELSWSSLNSYLIIFIVILFAITFFITTKGIVRLQNMPRFSVASIKESSGTLTIVPFSLKDYSYYKQILLDRNIFKPFEVKEKLASAETPQIQNMIGDLQLVGISWGEGNKEKFAMVEDKKSNITYYLQEGDKILDVKVKKIGEESVIFASDAGEVELR